MRSPHADDYLGRLDIGALSIDNNRRLISRPFGAE